MAVMQQRENVYVSTQIRNITLRESVCVCMSVCVHVENVEKPLASFIDASQILTCFSFVSMNRSN